MIVTKTHLWLEIFPEYNINYTKNSFKAYSTNLPQSVRIKKITKTEEILAVLAQNQFPLKKKGSTCEKTSAISAFYTTLIDKTLPLSSTPDMMERLMLQAFDVEPFQELKIIFTVKSNNVFAVFYDVVLKKIVASCSSKDLGFKTSKRLLQTTLRPFLIGVFSQKALETDELNKFFHFVTIKIVADESLLPIFLQEFDAYIFNRPQDSAIQFKGMCHFLDLPAQVAFNGCIGPKAVKKKQKETYLFK